MTWRSELHPREPRGSEIGGRFRFKSGPAQGLSSTRGRPPASREVAEAAAAGREGFSIHPYSARRPRTGYQVAVQGHTERYPESVLDDHERLAELVADHIDRHRGVYRRGGRFYVGGWVHEGELWLEPSERVRTRGEAVRLGVSRDQIAVWDNLNQVEIRTGGTGGG